MWSVHASKHTSIHTHVRNEVTLVWGSLRLAPTKGVPMGIIVLKQLLYLVTAHTQCTCIKSCLQFFKRLWGVRALLVRVVLYQKEDCLLEVLLHSESSSKGNTNFKVSCKFCREEFTHHGAMGSVHEHLKHKHPIEMEADQPRTRVWW